MTVEVLVTALGQQIVAGVKQIENKETNEIVGYWLSQPRVVQYTKDEEGNIGVNFQPYCLISDEAEFSLRADHVVAILEPREEVAEAWRKAVFGEAEAIVDDGTGDNTVTAEVPATGVTPATENVQPAEVAGAETTV